MRKIKAYEDERKFVCSGLNYESISCDKEFIIYQWYLVDKINYEKKLKLIFDFSKVEKKLVIVEKERTNITASNKTVAYLDANKFEMQDLLAHPFIMKRRSIFKGVHFDRFIYSNMKCKYLIEVEDEAAYEDAHQLFDINKEVSDDLSYRNIKMTIPFELKHLKELAFLLEILH